MVKVKGRGSTKGPIVITSLGGKKAKKNNGSGSGKKRVDYNKKSSSDAYFVAMAEPFSAQAMGARVPDWFSIPTKTGHITRRFALTTNASGEADAIILPSCYWHAVSPRGSFAGQGTWTALDGTTLANAVVYTTTASLSTQFVNYRIVGYGVKVMGTTSMTNTQGVVLEAKVPISSYINSGGDPVGGITPNISNANATKANTLAAYGVPNAANVVDATSLLILPESSETSLMALCERPMDIIPKITSAEAFSFRLAKDSAVGFNITDQSSVSNVQSGDASYLRLSGHEAVIIAATGCAASTSVLEVEVIYHIEGIPFISTSTTGYVAGDSLDINVDPISWLKAIQRAANLPSFRQAGAAGLDSVYPGLGTFAKRFM